jgi:hypothetical protein
MTISAMFKRGDGWIAGALCAVAILLWFFGTESGHPWGDDWAGYVMQARALGAGEVGREVAVNAEAMLSSDVQIGPDAYPWGYPLLLWAIGAEGDIEPLKLVGAISMVLLVCGAFVLARAIVGRWWAVLAVGCSAFQPGIVLEASFLGSDLPFAALATFALALTILQWNRLSDGRSFSPGLTLLVAVLSIAAFSIRSNGVVVPGAYLLMGILSWLRFSEQRGAAARDAFLLVASCGLLAAAYFLLLPDGSLSHASYLSFDPRVWLERAVRHFHYMASWVTLGYLRGWGKVIPFAAFVAVCVIGVLARPWQGLILAGYVAAHLILITVFPFDGGLRYYHPMLIPAVVLFVCGLAHWFDNSRWSRRAVTHAPGMVAVLGAAVLVGVLTIVVAAAVAEQGRYRDYGADAPTAAAARDVASYVAQNAPPQARIAFFKPRAFRLLSGRVAYAIQDPGNLERVDWYVFNGGTADTRTQVPESALQEPANGFGIVREISPFRVYVRDGGLPRANIAASGGGSP